MKSIDRSGPLRGRVTAPPSKSFSARALVMAAIAEGPTTVYNPLDSDDTRYMLEALKKIGFETGGSFKEGLVIGDRVSISANEVELSVGNAGTAMRFLTGFLSFTPGRFFLSGDARMHERPIGDLVEALQRIDSEIEWAEREGYPPIRIRGKRIRGGFEVSISGESSSQFISSLMMAGATLNSGLDIRVTRAVSRPYLEMTKKILRDFGVRIEEIGSDLIRIHRSRVARESYTVEGDYSSASYWIAAAAVTGGEIAIEKLTEDSVQGDRRFLDVITALGATVSWSDGVVTVRGPQQLGGGEFDCNDIPDVVPTLAAIAPAASAPIVIHNVANLRIKESDRLAVLTTELQKLGARVEERPDGLTIHPGWSEDPATIDPHGDHRIAMSFAVAGLARGNVNIQNETVVSKSYPRFWKTLEEIKN
jgi:3-phosphoshikimate 1-carboxyvinyltransferase